MLMSRIKLRTRHPALAASAAGQPDPRDLLGARVGDAALSLSRPRRRRRAVVGRPTLAGRPARRRAARRRGAAALTGGARAAAARALRARRACGLATSAAWTSVVFSAIRSNAPPGASRTRARARPSPVAAPRATGAGVRG